MNILYHHRTQGQGGEGIHIREMIKALESLGHTVTVIAPPGITLYLHNGSPDRPKSRKNKTLWGFISGHAPQIIFETLEIIYNIIAYYRISQSFKRTSFDLFYERYAFFCFAGAIAAKKHNIPYILEVNEISGIKRQRRLLMVNVAMRIEKAIFYRADAIATVSTFLRDTMAQKSVALTKISVIPNAFNNEEFQKNPDGECLRKNLGIENKLLLLFMGYFSRWDNLSFFLENICDLIEQPLRIHVVLIGEGKERAALEEYVRKREKQSFISFVGRIERREIPSYIDAADICVIPHSNPFGSPLVLFEYMGMGRAVVAPRLAPLGDIIRDRVDGVLFTPGDKESFKNAIRLLADDHALRKTIAETARLTILKNHLWSHNASKVIGLYNRIKRT